MEINNCVYKRKIPKGPESMNFESYLNDDIKHNLNLSLSPLEFNLLRIYKYLYIHLQGNFSSSTKYVINGNQFKWSLTLKVPKKFPFSLQKFRGTL